MREGAENTELKFYLFDLKEKIEVFIIFPPSDRDGA